MISMLKSALIATVVTIAPPEGRPPTGPLERVEPRLYDIRFDASISTDIGPYIEYREIMRLQDTPIVMPMIMESTFSAVDRSSMNARLWLHNNEDLNLAKRTRLEDGKPFHTHHAIMPIASFEGQYLRWQIEFRTKSWSSRFNDAAAGQIAWPKEFPKEVADGLRPQRYIQSDNPVFAETVKRISEGNLRFVPPLYAAKDIVRYCLNEIQVTGSGMRYEATNALQSMEMQGALKTASTGRGSPHDLVCVCVAMLRAAGIPARPVIGITEYETDRTVFVSWAEFYLPDCGWIPFDPNELRGKGYHHLNVRDPWPEFGTMKDLNRRIALSFHFTPPGPYVEPITNWFDPPNSQMRFDLPCVWGWQPQPIRPESLKQQLRLVITNRGRAEEPPQ